ncbi:unnamed protein product [Notodromas monacha]|uniref:Uncharacterized protein n=1 Tax=Notodromas monacha TaxID=399045 RepID=A0A7R9BYY0_9CRUS|nr:unnamed protein product [Notodromas monacha]CAG0924244.1 unnamed protein product [Notodromas monacha]
MAGISCQGYCRAGLSSRGDPVTNPELAAQAIFIGEKNEEILEILIGDILEADALETLPLVAEDCGEDESDFEFEDKIERGIADLRGIVGDEVNIERLHRDDPFDSERVKILLFGKAAHGKSSLANFLVGLPSDGVVEVGDENDDDNIVLETYKPKTNPRKTQRKFETHKLERFWQADVTKPVQIVDTVGYDGISENEIFTGSTVEALKKERYFHMFIFITTGNLTFAEDDHKMFNVLTQTFGTGWLKNVAVIVSSYVIDGNKREVVKDAVLKKLNPLVNNEPPFIFLDPHHTENDYRESLRKPLERFYEKIHSFSHRPIVELGLADHLVSDYAERENFFNDEIERLEEGKEIDERKKRIIRKQIQRLRDKRMRLQHSLDQIDHGSIHWLSQDRDEL